jgi:hypothetical protein
MAGRIRTVKPELLTDSKAARLSDTAWRLFVSSWLLADDAGRLPADEVILAGSVFPGRDARECSRALDELSRAGLVTVYEVREQRYAEIRGWKRHQKIDRPSGPKFPGPSDASPLDSTSPREDSRALDADHDHDHDHDLDLDQVRSEPSARRPRKQPAVALPADWKPSTAHHALASELGVRTLDEAIQFRDHAEATGRRAVSWDAAFRNWLRRAALYAARGAGVAGAGKNGRAGKPERYHAVRDRTAYADPEIERKEF